MSLKRSQKTIAKNCFLKYSRKVGEVGMMITEEMIAEDEKRWHARNIVVELGYCGKNIRHRINITNDDIRFYAYIMRKAHAMLKEKEALEERHKALVDAADDLRAELKEANQRIWELICEQDGRHYDDGK